MTSTLPYQINSTRGQRVSSNPPRSRLWPGHNTIKRLTVGGVYADGVYSYTIGSTVVSVTMAGSTLAGAAAALKAKHDSLALALDQAESSVSSALLDLDSRTPETTFVLSALTAPGAATLVQSDLSLTSNPARLRPGLFVALNNTKPEWLRRLTTGDTGPFVFGVTQEGPDMAPSTGDEDDVDGWDPGSMVTVQGHGEIPVICEQAVTNVNVGVFGRIIAPGTEEIGAARLDVDGGNAVAIANARWSSLSWVDEDGQITAMVIISNPAA
jgi:hypothetical protein